MNTARQRRQAKRPAGGPQPVARSDAATRAAFVARTYLHLLLAVFAFTGVQVALFGSGVAEPLVRAVSGERWLLAFAAFQLVAYSARRVARRAQTRPAQYLALGAFVLVQAVIFAPLLRTAQNAAPGTLESAVLVSALGFGGLTAVAFVTRRDFSFLGGVLRFGFVMALVLAVAALLFGFRLGVYFNVGMVALAGGAILRDTSRVLQRYPRGRHVAAALELFAAAALLFWHVLRLALRFSRRSR